MKILQFIELDDPSKKSCRNAYSIIDRLIKFGNIVTPSMMKELYGDSLGEHLWNTFLEYNRDITRFYNKIDIRTKDILFSNIFANEEYINTYGLK